MAARLADPDMVPLVALVIVRSAIAGVPAGLRAPFATPRYRCAIVAGAASPSNVPEIDSFVPLSVAVAVPLPVTLARSCPVIGTQPRRAVYLSPLSPPCPARGLAHQSPATTIAIATITLRV